MEIDEGKCPACGHEVLGWEFICPGCGKIPGMTPEAAAIAARQRMRRNLTTILPAVLLLGACVAAWFLAPRRDGEFAPRSGEESDDALKGKLKGAPAPILALIASRKPNEEGVGDLEGFKAAEGDVRAL